MIKMGSKEDFIRRLRERQKEFSEEEEMVEITFSSPRPATDEEKKKFEEFIKKARESGKDIFVPK